MKTLKWVGIIILSAALGVVSVQYLSVHPLQMSLYLIATCFIFVILVWVLIIGFKRKSLIVAILLSLGVFLVGNLLMTKIILATDDPRPVPLLTRKPGDPGLEHLLVKEYPTGRVVLVMDNASYHKSVSALAALSLFEHRVLVVWLPPFCSDLNPIERYWRHLKDRACANMLQDTIDAVMGSAEQTLIEQNRPGHVSGFHVSNNL